MRVMKYGVLAALLIQILLLGCFMDSQEGGVRISFSHGERSLWTGSEEAISSYTIILTGPSGEQSFSHDREEGDFLSGPLRPGSWTVYVEGKNGDNTIAVIDGHEPVSFTVRRSMVTELSVLLVPVIEGTSSLQVTLDWSVFDEDLIASFPNLRISMESLNGSLNHYPEHEGSSVITIDYLDNSESNQIFADLEDGSLELELETSSDVQVLDFSGLPPGLYRINLGLYASSGGTEGSRYWQGMWFAYLVPYGDQVTGEVTLNNNQLETGRFDIAFNDEMNLPLDFTVTHDDEWTMNIQEGVTFSMDGYVVGSGSPEYTWYINGEEKGSEDTLVHTFVDPGTYCVVLSLFDNGSWGAAAYSVEVKAEHTEAGKLKVKAILDNGDLLNEPKLHLVTRNAEGIVSDLAVEDFTDGEAEITVDRDPGWYEVTASLYEESLLYQRKVFILWQPEGGAYREITFNVTTYDVTYYLYEGDNHEDNPAEVTKVCEVTLKDPERSGYTFKGWFYEAGFVNRATVIGPGITRDISLYAKWEED